MQRLLIVMLAAPGHAWAADGRRDHPGQPPGRRHAQPSGSRTPALDPLWISYWEPSHGANRKDFGFQVTLKVSVE